MENVSYYRSFRSKDLKKMLSVLKMSFILLFLTLFQAVATNSYSQSVTISVKMDQAPLTDLFTIIEKQSDFLFFYVDSDVKNVKVSVNATDKSIENILSQALRNTSLKYSIEGRNINVFNKNIVAQQTKKRITGVVKDPEGNAIIGANVVEKGTTNGTITDLDGKYMMEVSSNATLEFSYIGYMTQLQPVGGKSDINVRGHSKTGRGSRSRLRYADKTWDYRLYHQCDRWGFQPRSDS